MPILRLLRALAVLAVALAAMVVIAPLLVRPAAPPWAPLDLGAQPGIGTATRLAALGDEGDRCRTLMTGAGILYRPVAERTDGGQCGYRDGLRWADGATNSARTIRYRPAAPVLACPLAAALALWEWDVVQPAAARLFGTTVVSIDHYGTYSCRRLYGRTSGAWSEHAHALAIDVAGFHLADSRRITVAADWHGHGKDAAFLHAVRDGACGLFATTLSPDYNAAHRDHLHLDEARRGGTWRACR